MIIHFTNGTRVKLRESKYHTFVYVADFSSPGYVRITQTSQQGRPRDEYTRLTIARDQLLFIDYENSKVMDDLVLFYEPEFTPDRYTEEPEILPGDVKEELPNG